MRFLNGLLYPNSNGKIYVTDFLLAGGGEASDPMQYSRIHILDEKTGNKILRFPAGEEGDLRGIAGDSLIFWHYNTADIFSASTGKSISKWSNKTLPKIFPELSSGIENTMIGDQGKLLEITTMDGNHWNLSLATGKLWPEKSNQQRLKYIPSHQIYLHNDDQIEIDDQPGGRTLLELDGICQNQDIEYLTDVNDTVVNKNLKFLRGKFIALDQQKKCFVVLSYETTQKLRFILTGISLDGKDKLWELRQSSLRPDDDMKYPISVSWNSDTKTDTLFFAMQDEVIAVQMMTGTILWRQKL